MSGNAGRLRLLRRRRERILLVDSAGEVVVIEVERTGRTRTVLVFDAPQSVQIWREEIAPPHLRDLERGPEAA